MHIRNKVHLWSTRSAITSQLKNYTSTYNLQSRSRTPLSLLMISAMICWIPNSTSFREVSPFWLGFTSVSMFKNCVPSRMVFAASLSPSWRALSARVCLPPTLYELYCYTKTHTYKLLRTILFIMNYVINYIPCTLPQTESSINYPLCE